MRKILLSFYQCTVLSRGYTVAIVRCRHRVHRVVTAAFRRTFHHEGKISLAGKGGGCTPTPFSTFTITSKVAVYAPAEWADTLTLFHLYHNMYSVGAATTDRLLSAGTTRGTDTVPVHTL
jgi:hypothetical protein